MHFCIWQSILQANTIFIFCVVIYVIYYAVHDTLDTSIWFERGILSFIIANILVYSSSMQTIVNMTIVISQVSK